MTATNAAVSAIVKTRYAKGMPKAVYKKYPHTASVKKFESWTGGAFDAALQTENPQGIAPTVSDAQGSLNPGNYQKFSITRVEGFATARVTGQAMRTVSGNDGAFVDLWRNEMDGASMTATKSVEWHLSRDGSGAIGAFTVSGTTNTMSVTEDIAGVDLGMRIQTSDGTVYASTPLTPTLRNGGSAGWVVEIDRSAGTFKVATTASGSATAIGTVITGTITGDIVYRYGEAASAGTAVTMTGERSWIVGGTAPGTLWGLNRNPDPTRRSGQEHDASGQAFEDALIDAESKLAFQGVSETRRFRANSKDLAKWRKSIGGKFTFPRGEMKSSVGIGFEVLEYQGENGKIQIISTPFQPAGRPILMNPETQTLRSTGPVPHLLNEDGNEITRLPSDDAYEVRFGWYGNLDMAAAPSDHIRFKNWGRTGQ
jgi:hypothetical protein